MRIYGWYGSKLGESAGNVALLYYNIVIKRFFPGTVTTPTYLNVQDYITSILAMAEATDKDLIIQLPFWDIFENYQPENRLTDWWPEIVTAVQSHPRIIGFYLFDEPELWGTEFAPAIPELTHAEALSLYNTVKSLTDKDCYSVFAGFTTFEQKYQGLAPFWDVFMFDVYPFFTQQRLDELAQLNPFWNFQAGSDEEKAAVDFLIRRWNELAEGRVVYVAQAYGQERFLDGQLVPNSGTRRDMTEEEFAFVTDVVIDAYPNLFGYMMWDWDFSNPTLWPRGNAELERWYAFMTQPRFVPREPAGPAPAQRRGATQKFTEYRTVDGDRWDTIAYKAYGDAEKGNLIVAANPFVKTDAVLPGGLRLLIPVQDDEPTRTTNLPPWKR